MTTPITVLQEMMKKLEISPEYECISQSGAHQQAMFECRCSANGHTATATAHSEMEAKQEAARNVLAKLAASGTAPGAPDTAPGASDTASDTAPGAPDTAPDTAPGAPGAPDTAPGAPGAPDTASGAPGAPDTAPGAPDTAPGAPPDTATASCSTPPHKEKARKDKVSKRGGAGGGKPSRNAALRVADYHLGLQFVLDGETLSRGADALVAGARHGAEVQLACVLSALAMRDKWNTMARERGPPLHVVTLYPSTPPLTFAGFTRDAAATAAVRYLRRVLPAQPAT